MTIGKPRPHENLEEGTSYWRSPRTVAAALVLACAAAGVAWAIGASDDTENTAAPAAYDSACGLTGGSTAEPTEAPAVQWQNVDGSWLPVSTAHGPGQRPATSPWSCYSRTPTGAVLAAWAIPASLAVTSEFESAVREYTAPGAGQIALLRKGPGDTPRNQLPVPLGFQVNAYDGTSATVTLYMRQRGANGRCAASVQWTGGEKGDWQLQLNSDGVPWSGCEGLPTELHGLDFIKWGPNS